MNEPEEVDYSALPYEPSYHLRKMRVFTAEWGNGQRGVSGVDDYHTKQRTEDVMTEGRLMLEVVIDPSAKMKTVLELLRDVVTRLEDGYWPDTLGVRDDGVLVSGRKAGGE